MHDSGVRTEPARHGRSDLSETRNPRLTPVFHKQLASKQARIEYAVEHGFDLVDIHDVLVLSQVAVSHWTCDGTSRASWHQAEIGSPLVLVEGKTDGTNVA